LFLDWVFSFENDSADLIVEQNLVQTTFGLIGCCAISLESVAKCLGELLGRIEPQADAVVCLGHTIAVPLMDESSKPKI
jgi:hypothetical protein